MSKHNSRQRIHTLTERWPIGSIVMIDIGGMARALRLRKREVWLMDFLDEFDRQIEQKRRQLDEAKDVLLLVQARVDLLNASLPILEEAKKVFSNDALADGLSLGHVLGAIQEPAVEQRNGNFFQNPFTPHTYAADVWDILAAVYPEPRRVTDIAKALARERRQNIPRTSVENVFYNRHAKHFVKVSEGLFRLATAKEREG